MIHNRRNGMSNSLCNHSWCFHQHVFLVQWTTASTIGMAMTIGHWAPLQNPQASCWTSLDQSNADMQLQFGWWGVPDFSLENEEARKPSHCGHLSAAWLIEPSSFGLCLMPPQTLRQLLWMHECRRRNPSESAWKDNCCRISPRHIEHLKCGYCFVPVK